MSLLITKTIRANPNWKEPWIPADTTPHYFFGLDLGRDRDRTALCVLERKWRQSTPDEFLRTSCHGEWAYTIRRLERADLGTPYLDIVDWVKTAMETGDLVDPRYRRTLIVDATGAGAAVLELLRAARLPGTLIPVVITGGEQPGYNMVTRPGSGGTVHTVSRHELLSKRQLAVEGERFRIAKDCKETDQFISELSALQSAGGKSSTGDDLAFAAALAIWWGLK